MTLPSIQSYQPGPYETQVLQLQQQLQNRRNILANNLSVTKARIEATEQKIRYVADILESQSKEDPENSSEILRLEHRKNDLFQLLLMQNTSASDSWVEQKEINQALSQIPETIAMARITDANIRTVMTRQFIHLLRS